MSTDHQHEPQDATLQDATQHPHEIHIVVDGEHERTTERALTARQIIRLFTGRSVDQVYLVQIEGHERESYRDRLDEPIKLHDGMRFQTVSLGPTPVSDGMQHMTGLARFVRELEGLGYKPIRYPSLGSHVVFDYVVESGTQAGKAVRIGLIIPEDFPNSAPSGPHISPRIFPIKSDGQHPYGAIHLDQAKPFEGAAGGEWQYWSRPANDWNTRRKTVAAYLSHMWTLWDSQ